MARDFDLEGLTNSLKDVVYLAVGVGVVSYQAVEKRWQDLGDRWTTQVDENKARFEQLTKTFETQVKDADQRAQTLEARFDELVADVEARLPGVAGEFVGRARKTAADARQQVRTILTPAA